MVCPVVPWFRAFEVLGPGDPPVPLIVLPFDSVLPPWPPAPVDEPELLTELWAMAKLLVQTIAVKAIAVNLMASPRAQLDQANSLLILAREYRSKLGQHRRNCDSLTAVDADVR
jgi:hypothetical protein